MKENKKNPENAGTSSFVTIALRSKPRHAVLPYVPYFTVQRLLVYYLLICMTISSNFLTVDLQPLPTLTLFYICTNVEDRGFNSIFGFRLFFREYMNKIVKTDLICMKFICNHHSRSMVKQFTKCHIDQA